MQAKIKNEGDVIIVHLIGRVDVETAEPFRKACMSHLKDKKVVFDFKELSFVGSSGITPFLETMQAFAMVNQNGFKLCGVGSEFKKIFAASPLREIEIFDNEAMAKMSFTNGPIKPVVLAPELPEIHAIESEAVVQAPTIDMPRAASDEAN